MHKLIADLSICAGYGNCVAAAPEVFDLSEEDLVVVLHADIADEELETVRDAVGACPTGALTLQSAEPPAN